MREDIKMKRGHASKLMKEWVEKEEQNLRRSQEADLILMILFTLFNVLCIDYEPAVSIQCSQN